MKYSTRHIAKKSSPRVIIFLLLVCSPLLIFSQVDKDNLIGQEPNWFNVIMYRIRKHYQDIDISENDNKYTEHYISISNPDGSFPDIDYDDKSQTNWKPLAHLNRMRPMILSYTTLSSAYYGDKSLYEKIVKMFEYWYDKHPLSTNWFNQQIASPQRVGVLLILMRSGQKQIPFTLENKLIERMEVEGGRPDQPGSLGTGANKIDIATHWIYRACLLEDEALLSFGTQQVYYPVLLSTKQGLQHDYSYQQHGDQLHIGGYGYAFVDGVSSIAIYMVGTPYEMSSEKVDHLSKFVREGYLPVIRGHYFMYNVVGRSISRKGALDQSRFKTVLEKMKKIDPGHIQDYDDAIARLTSKESASYKIEPSSRLYWRSDYMLHQRPDYNFDVRSSSIYTTRNENGNKEGLKGYFLVDGATELVINGDEFTDIFGVWDWTRIPGTTTPIMDTLPLPDHWEQAGVSKFAGGVSDNLYGIAAYVYDDKDYSVNTSAKKSWFMFDNEIVCLGADVQSTSDYEINTTINQCLFVGEVLAKTVDQEAQLLDKGGHLLAHLSWIYHNKIGYFFPNNPSVNVANESQFGSWHSINNSQSQNIETRDVLKVWINHGMKPKDAKYEYLLLPNIDPRLLENYSGDDIEIIWNNSHIQAVYHKKLDILGIVFYEAGKFSDKRAILTTDAACIVMLRDVSTPSVKVSISDPSRLSSEINLKGHFTSLEDERWIECTFSTAGFPYAGATQNYVIDAKTPKSKNNNNK